MVSKMVSEDKKKPLFMYRENRSRPEDSGWRIFSRSESIADFESRIYSGAAKILDNFILYLLH